MSDAELKFRSILELIQVVNKNMGHVQDLMTLAQLLKFGTRERIICATTINARYDYKLYLNMYNNPDDHIDKVMSIMDTPTDF